MSDNLREPIEVRMDGENVDEIVGDGTLHMEVMDEDSVWFALYPNPKPDGRRLVWWITGDNLRIEVTERPDNA